MSFSQTKYLLGSLLCLPLLPAMYWQARRIKLTMPQLPEAEGSHGLVSIHDRATIRLLCIGESTMAGVGVQHHEESFCGYLAQEMARLASKSVQWKVYAKSGYTAANVLDKIVPEIIETAADLIVIGLGANDAFKLNNPIRWNNTVRSLVQKLQTNFQNTPIAFISVPPVREFPSFTPLLKGTIGRLIDLLGDELATIVRDDPNLYYRGHQLTVKEWSIRHGIEAHPTTFFSDGVHPTALTYQLWAKDFAAFLWDLNVIKKG
jgi:lysophospholipase L1-like esterase